MAQNRREPRTGKARNPESKKPKAASQRSQTARAPRARKPVVPRAGTEGVQAVQDEPAMERVRLSEEELQARIASRAYSLYERRGGHHGQDLDDWLQAERQVRDEYESCS